jgi:hypothetical protein
MGLKPQCVVKRMTGVSPGRVLRKLRMVRSFRTYHHHEHSGTVVSSRQEKTTLNSDCLSARNCIGLSVWWCSVRSTRKPGSRGAPPSLSRPSREILLGGPGRSSGLSSTFLYHRNILPQISYQEDNLGLLTDVNGRTKKELEAQRWHGRVLVVIGKWPGRMYHDSMMNLSLRGWRIPVTVGFEADSNVS